MPVVVASILAMGLFAGESGVPSIDDWLVQRWTMDDGLPEPGIMGLAPGPDGHLWCVTKHHLVRFDGRRFTTIPSDRLPAQPATGLLLGVAFDGPTGIWLMGEPDLHHWDGVGWSRIDIPGMAIRARLLQDGADAWFVSNTGVLRCRGLEPNLFPVPKISWVHISGTGWRVDPLVIPTTAGLQVLEKGVPRVLSETGNRISKALHAGRRRMWCAWDHGLSVLEDGRWRDIPLPVPGIRIQVLWESGSGDLWMADEDAWLWRWQGERWMRLRLDTDGFPTPVYDLWEDDAGCLWLGCEGGLARLRPRRVRMLGTTGSVATWGGHGQDGTGNIWRMRTAEGIAAIDDTGQALGTVTLPDDLRIAALTISRDGTLWVGSQGGFLLRIRDGRRDLVTQVRESNREARSISALHETPDGTLWVGSWNGLLRYDPRQNGLQAVGTHRSKIGFIREDHDGSIWYAVQGQGVVHRTREEAEVMVADANRLPGSEVFDWYRDGADTIWLGGNRGLACWRADGRYQVFGIAQGLVDDTVRQITEDTRGHLWIGTRRGVQRLAKDDLLAVADGRRSFVGGLVLDRHTGLAADECLGNCTRQGREQAHDDLCFPTSAGLARIDAALVRDDGDTAVHVRIVAVESAGLRASVIPLLPTSDPPLATVSLPAGDGPVTIRFEAAAPSIQETLRFRHRLVGVDKDWTIAIAPSATWTSLPAGRHRFEVEVLGHAATATITISIPERWWRTPLAVMGLVLVSSLVVGGLVRIALARRWRRRLEQQQAVTRERERIARDIHDDLGAGLTELSMLGELIRHEVGTTVIPSAGSRIERICAASTELARSVDEIIWAADPAHDNAGSFLLYMGQHAERFLSAADLRYRLDFPDDLPAVALEPAMRHHLFLAVRETLANVVKHAAATLVQLTVRLTDHRLTVTIADNGCGFDASQAAGPHHDGLANLHRRMDAAGGTLTVASAPGAGTRITMSVPWDDRISP